MTRFSHATIAMLFAALIGIIGLAPTRASAMPAGSILAVDGASKPAAETVRWHRRGGYYGYRRAWARPRYYAPVRYYARPRVYYRRCVTRPRLVWTPYGYVRRWVRICR